MKRMILFTLLTIFSLSLAQQPDSLRAVQQPVAQQAQRQPSPVFFGGSFGLTFGSYFSLRVMPLVGYRVNPQLSVGAKVGYEYFRDKHNNFTITSHNYGGSVFTQFRIVPQLYVHGEFAYINYDEYFIRNSHDRDWVPFLLLGAGFRQKVGRTSWAFVEVLFDVLQSNKSPYDAWDPRISFGVSTGF